eukprot:536651_1
MGTCSSKLPKEKQYTKLQLIDMEVNKIFKFQKSQNKIHDKEIKHKESKWKEMDSVCPIPIKQRWKVINILNGDEFAIIETEVDESQKLPKRPSLRDVFRSVHIYNCTIPSWRNLTHDQNGINLKIRNLLSENGLTLISASFNSRKKLLYLLSYKVGYSKSIYDYKLGIFNIQNKQFKVHNFKMETKESHPIDGAYLIIVNDTLQLFIPNRPYHGVVTTTHLTWDDNLQTSNEVCVFDSTLIITKSIVPYVSIDVLIYDKMNRCILLFIGHNIYSYCMVADKYSLSKLDITTPIKFGNYKHIYKQTHSVMTNDNRYVIIFGGLHNPFDGNDSDSYNMTLNNKIRWDFKDDPFKLSCIYIFDIAERFFMKSDVECPKRMSDPTVVLLDKSIILIFGCIKQWYSNNDVTLVNDLTGLVVQWCNFGNQFAYIHLIGKCTFCDQHWVISVDDILSNATIV